MLYKEKLFQGLSVEIVVLEGEYTGRYRTRVEDVGQRFISIGVPVVEGQFIPLREGAILQITLADAISAYTFSTSIIKRITFPIPTFLIEFPNKINKVQRRKFVRVAAIRPLKYQIMESEGFFCEDKKGFVIDLSGGGMLFKAKERIPEKTILLLKAAIGENDMEITGIVNRANKEEDKDSFIVAAEFYEMPEKVRDKIVGYVFNLQREMRRKGLV